MGFNIMGSKISVLKFIRLLNYWQNSHNSSISNLSQGAKFYYYTNYEYYKYKLNSM